MCGKIDAADPITITKITYLKPNREGTRYVLTYLEISKEEQMYDWCFEGESTAWKVNVTFLMVINKETTCLWRIKSGNCTKIGMVDAFSS